MGNLKEKLTYRQEGDYLIPNLQNVDEKLKASNQMELVKLMNNFKNSAEETILKELIYN